MFWAKMSESSRTLLYSVAVVGLVAAALIFGAKNSSSTVQASSYSALNAVPAATFSGTGVGSIPDGTSPCWNPGTSAGGPLNVTFNVTGITGSVSSVEVTPTFGGPNHSFMGDVTAILIAPNGASHTLFGHTLATTATAFGDSSDLGAAYTFSDNAPAQPNGGWWQASNTAGAAVVMPTGTYRTTASGGAGAVNPQPPTSMNPAFTGVANANGTWTLRVTDNCAADTGAVSAATLSVVGGPSVAADANVDINGDGKTDWVVARGTNTPGPEESALPLMSVVPYDTEVRRTPGTKALAGKATESNILAPPIFWYTQFNGAAGGGVGQLGDAATDFITPEDFDGDGKDDLAVWTPGPPNSANFKIFQSTTNTIRTDIFGVEGDDPAVVGDYDGDGKADPAVYRCPPFDGSDGQCYFFYRGSFNNPSGNIAYVPWGFGVDGDFFPLIGDFDGDGKNDFCVQMANPSAPSQGLFALLKSNGLGVEWVNWGQSSDFLIPGDYDGDGKADFCVRRTVGGNRQHWVLFRTGATTFAQWGVTGDVSTPGDYDGDGKTDFAIWRGNSDPNQNFYWVLNSSNLSVTTFEWGACPTVSTCDFPVAGWAVH
jgi:hypothetical protein